MRSVFRNIRQQMVTKNKVGNYILYAIGEIALVMVGILLALQVNNWNEHRKLKNTINNTLRTIAIDLETDTIYASSLITHYEKNQENSKKILNNEITTENYMECPECLSLVTIYQPFNVQQRGFEQLKLLNDNHTTQRDSLITDIIKFYSVFNPIIQKNNDRMESIVMKNFHALEQYPWFVDMSMGKITPEVVAYFTTSEDYKKRVASHAMLAVGNHLTVARQYKEQAVHLLNRIDKRLEGSEITQ